MKFARTALLLAIVIGGAAAESQQAAQEGSLRVPDAAQFVGPPKGAPLTGDALYERTEQIGTLLRCPVCQGMAISDSPAEMAVNMKHQVRELLARGYTEEQILRYFELSYGQFVLLKPKFEGVNRLVWLLPLVALLGGGAVLFFAYRRLARQPAAPAPVTPSVDVDDPYLARVRQLVTGDESK